MVNGSRTEIPFRTKRAIKDFAKKNPDFLPQDILNYFQSEGHINITINNVRTALHQELDHVEQGLKYRMRGGSWPVLEEALCLWLQNHKFALLSSPFFGIFTLSSRQPSYSRVKSMGEPLRTGKRHMQNNAALRAILTCTASVYDLESISNGCDHGYFYLPFKGGSFPDRALAYKAPCFAQESRMTLFWLPFSGCLVVNI